MPASTWRRRVQSERKPGSRLRIRSTDSAGDSPHPGCNCGRRRSAPTATPLLTDDLVIAARDRAREPELPEATLARALGTSISPRLARYDVIVVSNSLDDERATRIAAEFARHEHRVFHFGEHSSRQLPAAPTLHRIATPPARSGDRHALLDALASLRRSEAIETAVLFALPTLDAETAREVRRRWGWRIVASSDAPFSLGDEADVLLA